MVAVTVADTTKMSALSVRSPGLQAMVMLDSRSRLRAATALDSVRRNLFGCEDRGENRRFVERELSRQLEIASERWGFDFAQGRPLPGAQRFAWQLVPAPAVPPAPEAVAGAGAPPAAAAAPASPPSPAANKTQKRITDFMKARKRPSAASKKSPSPARKHDCSGHGAHLRPPKVARLTQTHFKRC